MTSKYEEMCDVATTARKNWFARRERCRQYMATLVHSMLSYCGIPAERVRYLRWNGEEEEKSIYAEPEKGDYSLPGAMTFDDDGDCRLGMCVVLTPPGTFPERWASFGLCVSEKEGKVIAKLAETGKPWTMDFNDSRQCNEFYDVIVDNIKRSFTQPQKASVESIGFKRSQLAADDENQQERSVA